MSPPVVKLPYQFNGITLSQVAEEVARHAANGWPEEVCFDFSGLSFVRPAGVTFLSNLIQWLHEKNTRVTLVNIGGRTAALNFLDDALFFEQHRGKKLREEAAPRATTRPLMRIAHERSHSWLQTDLLPWLAARLDISEASLYKFKNCVAELFNNIQDHTRHEIGTVFAQHFPQENRVYISLSDFGLGIPAKVREKLPALQDGPAILKAVEEGFTTKSTPSNQGIGLDYLLKAVVAGNGGTVTFYSLNSIMRFERVEGAITPRALSNVGFCPGTTIDIVLRTDTIEQLPDEPEDLVW
ncbi:STAS domain-containing protein [Bradyrhizobium elkanii]|uniref:STAS domain-containing protein n=1 Tax=Bradyrhizobium elkanii TaxID=29448 RepID=UPI0005711FAA|nr:STAS domain-containing protein [Bradyrhizobium elkanii]